MRLQVRRTGRLKLANHTVVIVGGVSNWVGERRFFNCTVTYYLFRSLDKHSLCSHFTFDLLPLVNVRQVTMALPPLRRLLYRTARWAYDMSASPTGTLTEVVGVTTFAAKVTHFWILVAL